MAINIKKFLIWNKIDRSVLKSLLSLFKTSHDKVKVTVSNISTVKIKDIMNFDAECNSEIYNEYKEVFDLYGSGVVDLKDTALWKREVANAPSGKKTIIPERRFKDILELYNSIKNTGFVKKSGNMVKLLYIGSLSRKNEVKYPDRVTTNYYRLSGKRRILICKYLGIEEIPVYVSKVKVVVL